LGTNSHLLKQFVTLLLAYFISLTIRAQAPADTSAVDVSTVADTLTILTKTQLLVDSNSSLSLDQALQKKFSPLIDFPKRKWLPPAMVAFSYYLKFTVYNSSTQPVTTYLLPGLRFEKKVLYKIGPQMKGVEDDEDPGYLPLVLAPGERCDVLVYLKPLKTESDFIFPRLIETHFLESYKLIYYGNYRNIKTLGYVLSGILLMMMFFMITNFILNLKREFLYNALYSLCMFALIYFTSYTLRTTTTFANFYLSYLNFFLQVMGIVFYIYFTRTFLNTKVNYTTLDKVLRYGETFMLLLLVVFTYLNFFTGQYTFQWLLSNIMKFLMLAVGICFIVLSFKERNRLLNYLAAGNMAMVVFGAISQALILAKTITTGFYNSPLVYYYIGIVLELVFFLMGLTYKNRSELIEKTKQQEAFKLEAEKAAFETEIAIIKAQQEERNRISADMHDDLGAGMTTIRLYSELAKNKLGANPIPEIDKISSSANELLNKMNAIIWSMSSSNDSLGNMIAYIRSYALEYFENSGVACRISIPENLPNIEVTGKIRRNVFLVVKEALNNILKHAKATEVTITLVRVPDGLTLYIQDNGVGINFDQLRQFSNGLINMKQRMTDIDIDFSIERKNGTLITLHRKIETF
jgi:signal transduction histidine kinase